MKILSYKYSDAINDDAHWDFSEVNFHDTNLLVGDSGTGKTRFLNTIFSLGAMAASSNKIFSGRWIIKFKIDSDEYSWTINSIENDQKGVVIDFERLIKTNKAKETQVLIGRDSAKFLFLGNQLPKLSDNQTSISLLMNEETIRPIHKGFSQILRRYFSFDTLSKATEIQIIGSDYLNKIVKEKKLDELFLTDASLNSKLVILNKNFPKVYQNIIQYYMNIFPFIDSTAIVDINKINNWVISKAQLPVFCIREKSVQKQIQISELSSGMLKVLLILTDIFLLPNGSIYLIDEYENSLGINPIGFLPDLIEEIDKDIQVIITSHHPYVINNIPMQDWFVFHRKGSNVTIVAGEELEKKYGPSKQKAFIQLINDPNFTSGIE